MSDNVAAGSSSTAGSSSSTAKLRNIYVLLADGDEELMKAHQTLLEETPFEMDVETVMNGDEVVENYRDGESYDIVFLDQKLPTLDGAKVTKALREMKVKSYIVGLYTEYDEKELNIFIKSGLDVCIKKPLTEEKIELILRKTIDKGSKD